MKAAFFCDPLDWVPGGGMNFVYGHGRRERIAALTELHPVVVTTENFESQFPELADIEVIFSTWGMPRLTAAQVALMPKLKAVLYAAGSIKSFARPFLEAGVSVSSAFRVNAIPVAEFTVSQILLAMKGYFRNTREYTSAEYPFHAFKGPGNYGATVALIGFGAISRKVVELLAPYRLRKLVVSRHLGPEEASRRGVETVTLGEAFSQAFVVSNHLADLSTNKKIIGDCLLRSMCPGAVFINTGRGAQVDEDALVEVMRERPDLTALLDVTAPEPPRPGSPLFTLPNVLLSTHIAGAWNDEALRMADVMITEFEALRDGRPLKHAIALQRLETLA